MMFAKHLFIFSLCLQFYFVILNLQSCHTRLNCEECIQDPDVCVWCAMKDFNKTRCRNAKSLTNYDKNWCPTLLQNPNNTALPTSEKPFNFTPGYVVQIKPQSYKLKLRPGKPKDFSFSFQGAKHFPVDLYFLLDASNTMASIKNETAAQSKNIYLTLKNLTNDVYLGLGTFVDKRLYPFTRSFNSEETYSFKHRLSLTEDYKEFENKVSNNPNGVNRDSQEGGLDALAQAITCKEVVGWRNESRKIIVFLTDAPYHFAGDGKSAGLFQPYDGNCYTVNGTYTKELTMDYPSVSMINKLASERDIIIMFLVEDTYSSVYQSLSAAVSGSKIAKYYKPKRGVAPKPNDQRIVHLLTEVYRSIVKKIKFKVTNRSGKRKNYEISFRPNCTTDDSASDCNVELGKEQYFDATIKLLRYDDLPNNEIDISVEGFSEKLTLDVEFIKSCECDSNPEKNSEYCSGEIQQCGICKCGENRYGERCGCKKDGDKHDSDNSTCIAEGSNSLCSGKGSCICGTCSCMKFYEGKFCECNKVSCKQNCNDHGNCLCGKCACTDGWTGDACQCSESTTSCEVTERNVTNICNNHGRCICDACACDPVAQWDVRTDHDTHCKMQPCTDCHDLQCSVLKNCVACKLEDKECSLDICPENINTTLLETLSEDYLNSTEWESCNEIRVKVGCYTRFAYRYNDEDYSLEMVVQETLNCDENYLIYGGVCLGTLLLIGLCTLVAWKLLTDARDRREYNDFAAKHGDMTDHCNPLYAPPVSNVKNPMFRTPSVGRRVR